MVEMAGQRLAALGLTAACEADMRRDSFGAFAEADASGLLSQRIYGLVVGHDDIVDDLPLHQRDRGRRHRGRQRADQRDDDTAAVTPAVSGQPSQPPVSRSPRARRAPCPP